MEAGVEAETASGLLNVSPLSKQYQKLLWLSQNQYVLGEFLGSGYYHLKPLNQSSSLI